MEEIELEKFLQNRQVVRLLKKGGEWALVFNNTAIGRAVIAKACDKNYLVTISKNITDYSCW